MPCTESRVVRLGIAKRLRQPSGCIGIVWQRGLLPMLRVGWSKPSGTMSLGQQGRNA
jgi:hypothetical protein